MKNTMFLLSKARGFTIIEFMVASVLGLVVLGAVGSLYMYTNRLNAVAQERVAVQQSLRTAGNLIVRDARMAGTFGCMSLGRLHATDTDTKLSNDFEIDFTGATDIPDAAKIKGNPKNSDGSFGVRWVNNTEMKKINAIATSGGLIFTYGAGSSGVTGVAATLVTFSENDPNQVLTNTISSAGYVVAASCRALTVVKADKDKWEITLTKLKLPVAAVAGGTTVEVNPQVNEHSVDQLSLMRYMTTVYFLGSVAGEAKTALYRVELQDNGSWSHPELLARNVTAMSADFVYIDTAAGNTCPAAISANPTVGANTYKFIQQTATGTNNIRSGSGKFSPPIAVNLTLTYDYPQVSGQATNVTETGNTFRITAALRGNNVCANRTLEKS
ncbi:MAG: prepilin-type N-terminal cleavage/methylation domain-containing protein [Neisseria sp.]|nr:prepilin-type N-terminal cleavage/methylation domain-containing protein [Neisseria sp.]